MPDSARASAPVAATSASTRCMKGTSAAPSGVSVTGPWPGPRLKRSTPSSSSSRRTWRDSEGWARCSRAAACVKLFSSATARAYAS